MRPTATWKVLDIPGGYSLGLIGYTPDGSLVATAGSDGTVRVWDGPTLER